MTGLAAAAGDAALVAPGELAGAWPVDPRLVLLLAAGAALYTSGVRELWGGEAGRRALPPWRVWCFAAAVAATVAALLSPLEALSTTLVAAHMGQHLLLTIVIAPLLVLARPLLVGAMALPHGLRRQVWRVSGTVLPDARHGWAWAAAAVIAHAGTMWVWHYPPLYSAALASTPVHYLEHATLLAGAVLLWWLVADARSRHANAVSVVALLVAAMSSAWLAGLVTFSPAPWLGRLVDGAHLWNTTPAVDQEVAGGLLWFPGALAYVIGGSWAFLRWLRLDERQVADRRDDPARVRRPDR